MPSGAFHAKAASGTADAGSEKGAGAAPRGCGAPIRRRVRASVPRRGRVPPPLPSPSPGSGAGVWSSPPGSPREGRCDGTAPAARRSGPGPRGRRSAPCRGSGRRRGAAGARARWTGGAEPEERVAVPGALGAAVRGDGRRRAAVARRRGPPLGVLAHRVGADTGAQSGVGRRDALLTTALTRRPRRTGRDTGTRRGTRVGRRLGTRRGPRTRRRPGTRRRLGLRPGPRTRRHSRTRRRLRTRRHFRTRRRLRTRRGFRARRRLGMRRCLGARRGFGVWGKGGAARFRAHAPPVSSGPARFSDAGRCRGPLPPGPARNDPSRTRIPAWADRHPGAGSGAPPPGSGPPCVRVTLRRDPARGGTSPRAGGIGPDRPPTLR